MNQATIERLRRALANVQPGAPATRSSLARQFDLGAAEREGLITFARNPDNDRDPLVISTEIDPALWAKAASAAAVPRQAPTRSADGNLYFWLSPQRRVHPFAVQRHADGSYCLALTTQGSTPALRDGQCWSGEEGENRYPPQALQHALVDAYDANVGWSEGLYQTPQPWRHPLTDRPLRLRKP